MKFIRKHISLFYKLTTGAFISSWVMLVLALPVQTVALAESYQVFSVFNAAEDCFELVIDHHKNADSEHFADGEGHDQHSFHSSCCYDDFLVKLKNQDVHHALIFEQPVDEVHAFSSPKTPTVHFFEENLPPPVTLSVIRVTRLLV
ncbi:MAG: hypothetical protein WD317_11705 [Balneolaceae bacterium]